MMTLSRPRRVPNPDSSSSPLRKVVVGIADMKVSNDPHEYLVTFALGSCLGITLYDYQKQVGGMVHIPLPDSSIAKGEPDFNPLKFVDTAVPLLFKECYRFGATKRDIKVKVAGCSQISDAESFFNIGRRNYAALRRILWRNGVFITSEDCGNSLSRTMTLSIATGETLLKVNGREYPL